MGESKSYNTVRKKIKDIIVASKKQYVLVFLSSITLSVIISIILVNNKDITPTGAIILSLFQVFVYNTFWFSLETKFRLEDRDNLKTNTDKIIEAFAKSNFLSERLNDSFLDYLALDKNINKEPHNIKEYHLHIFNLKLKSYLNEYFNVDSNGFAVLDIPTSYFEKKIWERFIDISPWYLSIQTLTDEKIDVYINNDERKNREMNFLESKVDGDNHTTLKKVFVIDDEYFDESNKLKNTEDKHQKMYSYINEWKAKFPKICDSTLTNHFPIKVAKKSQVEGLVEDIGIFGPVHGIQKIRNDNRIMEDKLKIDFYFSEFETQKKKNKFDAFFNKDEVLGLSDVF